MNEFFATVYETWFNLYNPNFNLIFSSLVDAGAYTSIGISLLLIPLILLALFYFLWKSPYGTWLQWLLWLVFCAFIVSVASYSIANSSIFSSNIQTLNDALADSSTGYASFADSLPMKFASINFVLALFIGFAYSLFLKRFSKIQIHLPF